MFGLTTTRRLQSETDALRAQLAQALQERDNTRAERDSFRAAAKTAARQVADATDRAEDLRQTQTLLRTTRERLVATEKRAAASDAELKAAAMDRGEPLIEGGTPRPFTETDELRALRRHNAALEIRLRDLTLANARCHCQRWEALT